MSTIAQAPNPLSAVTTSSRIEKIADFRVVRTQVRAAKVKGPRTLAEANQWLVANTAKVQAHAKASTKRLIGRDSV